MIYKVTVHISTLYIYIYQISSTQELSTLQETKERKKNSYMIYIHKKLPTQNGKKILHNGEYQSRQTMKMKNIHYISYFIQIFYISNYQGSL